MNLKWKNNKLQFALLAVCLAALMFGFEISSVPVSLPSVEKQLRGNFRDIQWIMNAYTIACCTVLMAAGTLADKYGRKKIFNLSIVLFGLTSLMCGAAQRMDILILSRFLQGISGGAMFIGAIANLSAQFPDGKARASAFSVWGVIVGIGLGFGPIIGSTIMTAWNWRWIFLVHVPVSVLTLLLSYRHIGETKNQASPKLDIYGILLLALTILGLTYYIIQGAATEPFSIQMLSILLGSIACFMTFIWVEKHTAEPMFDLSVFRINNFSGAIMGSIGMNFSFWPFIIYLPILFQTGLGYSIPFTGMCLLAYTLPSLVVPPIAEYLTFRFRAAVVIPSGLFMIGAGFLLMRYGCLTSNPSWKTLIGGMVAAGAGLGLTNTPVTNTATGSVSKDRVGMASGIDSSARLITLAINIAVMGLILTNSVFDQLSKAVTGNLPVSLNVLADQLISGDITSTEKAGLAAGLSRSVVTKAFGTVLLFGGIGVWMLAAFSFLLFRRKFQSLNSAHTA